MNSLEYNTERTKLIIPEYGRHIHQMIDQAVALKDKDKRNNMAKAIIGVMGNLNPHLRDVPDFQHKLWAQLFIMSNFELDADSPFEKPSKEILFDGFVALGCIIRGETYHFEIVSNESARALSDLSITYSLPIGNGILTC